MKATIVAKLIPHNMDRKVHSFSFTDHRVFSSEWKMKCLSCSKWLFNYGSDFNSSCYAFLSTLNLPKRFIHCSGKLQSRRNTVGFTHGDVEEERVKQGFGADGKYTKLPEPIRDYSKEAPDLKLNKSEKAFDPYAMEKKNLGANDFYDVLADTGFDMKRNINAPYWVKRAAGRDEIKRVLSKKKAIGSQLTTKEVRLMNKRVWYLFKKYNFKTSQDAPPYPK